MLSPRKKSAATKAKCRVSQTRAHVLLLQHPDCIQAASGFRGNAEDDRSGTAPHRPVAGAPAIVRLAHHAVDALVSPPARNWGVSPASATDERAPWRSPDRRKNRAAQTARTNPAAHTRATAAAHRYCAEFTHQHGAISKRALAPIRTRISARLYVPPGKAAWTCDFAQFSSIPRFVSSRVYTEA